MCEIIAIVMLVLVEVLPEEQTSQTTISETGFDIFAYITLINNNTESDVIIEMGIAEIQTYWRSWR